jgi:hypothetical protein
MRCAECHLAIDFYGEDITVRVVYSDERGIEKHCQHSPFNEDDSAILAVLGSAVCTQKWLRKRANIANMERRKNVNN